jgi:hypothetical protein
MRLCCGKKRSKLCSYVEGERFNEKELGVLKKLVKVRKVEYRWSLLRAYILQITSGCRVLTNRLLKWRRKAYFSGSRNFAQIELACLND